MKPLEPRLTIALVALFAAFAAGPANAQMMMDKDKMGGMKMDGMKSGGMEMAEGEVRKVDKAAGTVTLKHGPIKHTNVNMDAMTMSFRVKDKSMLDPIKEGDRVNFMVVSENGEMLVTEIRRRK